MKKYYSVLCLFVIIYSIFLTIMPVKADLPLEGKVIVVDPGHGGVDPGTVYGNIYEKDIVLNISLYLEKYLSSLGATVILTRYSDKDLSNGVKSHRKKTDFDNRIEIINNDYTDMYLSIHLNYLNDSRYFGPQVFYNEDSQSMALIMQSKLNKLSSSDRKIKRIPTSTYMYDKLNKKGLLIECGFLSNTYEREKLITSEYQEKLAKLISEAVVKYYL